MNCPLSTLRICNAECPLWINFYQMCSLKVLAITHSPDNFYQILQTERKGEKGE